MKDNKLTEFNGGGTHEQNPVGGIPQGTDASGGPVTVEQGETKANVDDSNYIYSDRIYNKESYVKAYALPPYTVGKTFAESSKLIESKFKDRSDNASNSTKEELLSRLKEAQEMAKLEMEAAELNISVEDLIKKKQDDKLQAAEEQVEQEAAPEEDISSASLEDGTDEDVSQFKLGGILKGVGSMAGSMSNDLTSDKEVREDMNVGGTAAKYALMGAAAGSVVPGIGTAIGAGVGAIAGGTTAILNNKKASKERQDHYHKKQGERLKQAGYGSDMAYGGHDPIRPYEFGKYFTLQEEEEGITPIESRGISTFSISADIPTSTTDLELSDVSGSNQGTQDEQEVGSKVPAITGAAASLVPLIGNIAEYNNLELDDPTRYARVGRTYTPEFADEYSRVNQVQDSYSGLDDSIANAVSGDLGAYRSNLLGANISKARRTQEAYETINAINRDERKLLNADEAKAIEEEVRLSNWEARERELDKAAYDQARLDYRKSIYEGIGKIGETLFQTSQQSDMTPYDIFGRRKKTTKDED